MNDIVQNLLTVLIVLWILFVVLLIWFAFMVMRRLRKAKRIVLNALRDNSSTMNFDLEDVELTQREKSELKDWLRTRKEREAHDSDIIDKATRYQRDFERDGDS